MALVGMQPAFRHTPPTFPASIQQVLAPRIAARKAATYPPGPAPRTATSYVLKWASSVDWAAFGEPLDLPTRWPGRILPVPSGRVKLKRAPRKRAKTAQIPRRRG